MIKPKHFNRYKELLTLLVRHGGFDLIRNSHLDVTFLEDEFDDTPIKGDPEQFAQDLEQLGPTFIKLGQLLSTRPDLLPQPYIDQLTRLQDDVVPFPYAEVEAIVADELGQAIERAFTEFNSEPIAAASLGQVHQARLPNGMIVAVKIQRPGIRQVVLQDFEIFDTVATALDKHTNVGKLYSFQDIVAEFRKTLLRELDYRREAQNLIIMGRNLQAYRSIIVPQPVEDYTTSRVLTMEYIDGVNISELATTAKLKGVQFEGQRLATDLCKAYLDQVITDGFFHADPHPGNVFIVPSGQLALIDLGMVAQIHEQLRENLLKLLLAISEGESVTVARITKSIGTPLDEVDQDRFTRQISDIVAHVHEAAIDQMQMGRILIQLASISVDNNIRPAPELSALGKTLLHLDEVARLLDPKFEPNRVFEQHASLLLTRHIMQSFSPSNLFASMLELNSLVRDLPIQLNDLLEALTTKQFEIKVNALDEAKLMANLQKVANRITVGLILAALIVGAALMMDIETQYSLFGYPAIAMIFFLVAAACGLGLVINIFIYDFWYSPK